VFEYVAGPISRQLLGRSFPATQGIAGKVFRTGRALLTNDVPGEQAHFRQIAEETGYLSRTMITAPLTALGGRTLGVLQAINKRHGEFVADDVELLRIVATQAATIIESARLHEAARLGAVARLLGNVGHDVKNMIAPIVACGGALEAILEKHFALLNRALAEWEGTPGARQELAEKSEQTRSRCLEAIRLLERAAERVRQRTAQMADCLHGNISPPEMEPTDIPGIVTEVVCVLQPAARARDIDLSMEQSGSCPPLLADSSRIFNAVYNLVINAIPETPRGGRVTARVVTLPDGAFPEGCCVRIEVRDTGRGIPPEVLRKLFTGEVVSTKPGGTGLGTRIVRDVADIHGGTVSASSEPGQGSCFTLTLPLRPIESPSP
jgi:signal transduction histidine kinase